MNDYVVTLNHFIICGVIADDFHVRVLKDDFEGNILFYKDYQVVASFLVKDVDSIEISHFDSLEKVYGDF